MHNKAMSNKYKKPVSKYYTVKYVTCELAILDIKMSCSELLRWLQDEGYISDSLQPIEGVCPAGTLACIEIDEEITLDGAFSMICTRDLYFTVKGVAYFVGLIAGIKKRTCAGIKENA